jgi:alpha-pyrone synthase
LAKHPGSAAYITSFGTAVPSNRFDQHKIADFMSVALQLDASGRRRLHALYRSTKIGSRHSVLADYGRTSGDFSFYPATPDLEPFPTVGQRMELYRAHAVSLAEQAIRDCLSRTTIEPASITHLITVSCTGMYAPGPDIELVTRLGLSSSVHRVAVNFMGCYGAFNGLKAATAFVEADPEARVLVVCVELCTIHFQKKNEEDHLLANALFADGAAAVLLTGEETRSPGSLQVVDFACELIPEGKDEMGWHVSDFGFEMKLTSRVPELLKTGFPALVNRLVKKNQADAAGVKYYAIHPGGRRILEVVEEVLDLPKSANEDAYAILQNYGNMSSATIPFILKKLWEKEGKASGDAVIAAAFGPGLTAETALLRIV